jgi:hypothetical protein
MNNPKVKRPEIIPDYGLPPVQPEKSSLCHYPNSATSVNSYCIDVRKLQEESIEISIRQRMRETNAGFLRQDDASR